ncbi:hypothetical protein [Brevundimonas sp.]|uniref:hypothetical protein n=1 Tax=Brevundimonas sp. TaxID=1871086 RepID=UPI003F7251B5
MLGALCATGTILGLLIWPAHDRDNLPHRHDDLPSDDPHLLEGRTVGSDTGRAHPYVIDDRRHRWLKTRG